MLPHRCVHGFVCVCVSVRVWEKKVGKGDIENGWIYSASKWVFVPLSIYICLSGCLCVCSCIRILAPGQPECRHDWWLVRCSESLFNESKMRFGLYDFIRSAQFNVRLMKCGKLFSYSLDHAFYSTMRPLLNRVSALSCHHCDWTDTGWSAVSQLIVVTLGVCAHEWCTCRTFWSCQLCVRSVCTEYHSASR